MRYSISLNQLGFDCTASSFYWAHQRKGPVQAGRASSISGVPGIWSRHWRPPAGGEWRGVGGEEQALRGAKGTGCIEVTSSRGLDDI